MVKNPPVNAGDARNAGLISGSGRSPGGGHDNPILVFLPGESHGQRNLAGYSPWGCKELDMTELLILSLVTLAKAFPWTRSRLRTWGLGERTKGLKDCSGFPRVLPAQEVCSCLRAFAHALSYLGHPSQGTHKTCSFLSFKSFLKC